VPSCPELTEGLLIKSHHVVGSWRRLPGYACITYPAAALNLNRLPQSHRDPCTQVFDFLVLGVYSTLYTLLTCSPTPTHGIDLDLVSAATLASAESQFAVSSEAVLLVIRQYSKRTVSSNRLLI
jgi:hypothetical protein